MSDDPLAHWLLTGGPAARDLRTAFQELIERLEGEGIPLLRTALNVDMLHPEMLAAMYTWQRSNKLVKRSDTAFRPADSWMLENLRRRSAADVSL